MRQDNVLALSSEIIWQQAKEALDRVKEAFKAIIILLRTLQTRYSVVLYNAQHHKKGQGAKKECQSTEKNT